MSAPDRLLYEFEKSNRNYAMLPITSKENRVINRLINPRIQPLFYTSLYFNS